MNNIHMKTAKCFLVKKGKQDFCRSCDKSDRRYKFNNVTQREVESQIKKKNESVLAHHLNVVYQFRANLYTQRTNLVVMQMRRRSYSI